MSVFRWQVLENKSYLLRHCIFIPSVYRSMKYIGNLKKTLGLYSERIWTNLFHQNESLDIFLYYIFFFEEQETCNKSVFIKCHFFSWKTHHQLCSGQHQLCVSLNIHWHLTGRNMSVVHDENISLIWISKP